MAVRVGGGVEGGLEGEGDIIVGWDGVVDRGV